MRNYIILALLCTLSACGTAPQSNQGANPAPAAPATVAATAAPAEQGGTVLCKGRLSIRMPAEWAVHVTEKATYAIGQHGEKFELVGLQRPPNHGESIVPSADGTLREFIALKSISMQKVKTTKYWPYTIYQASPNYQAAWTAALSPSQTVSNGSEYAIQYLIAEPGIVFMMTFDKDNVTEADVLRDKETYDSIIKTAWRREMPVQADSVECK